MSRFITSTLSTVLATFIAANGFPQSREMSDRDDLTVGQGQRTPPTNQTDLVEPDTAEVAQRIVEQTNAFRGEHGLPALDSQEQLTAAAQYFAEYMGRTGKYGHTADGKRPSERAREHGYDYCLVLENIAYQYSSRGFATQQAAEKFVTGWKESEGHRENMLDADVQETGVAVAAGESGEYFAVQMFGRPASAAIEFTVTNDSGEEVVYQLLSPAGPKNVTLPPRATATHTRCRPPQLKLGTPDTDALAVEAGDRFVITGSAAKPQLQRSTSPPPEAAQ